MAVAECQLELFAVADPKPQRTLSHLANPLSREESRRIGKLYAENIGLIKSFGGKLARKYGHCLAREDIFRCIDLAFIKAARTWDPAKAKLSTIFWRFAEGEVLHYLRSHNWTIRATHKVRQLGGQARKLLDLGWSTSAVCRELHCSRDDLKDALVATAGVAHDIKGFDLHVCPRPSPWEVLEAEEEREARAS